MRNLETFWGQDIMVFNFRESDMSLREERRDEQSCRTGRREVGDRSRVKYVFIAIGENTNCLRN